MKFFLLFSLFILSSFTLSCNELSFQNDTIVNYTTNKYNELYKKKSSIEDLDKHVYANLRELRDFISQKKNIADSSLIELKDTYANYLVLLQGDYFMFKGEIDSVIHYNNKVRDYTNNYYLLGRSESITSYAYQIKNRYAEQIISLKKAIDYYDKSNHIHANYRKSELQIFLFGVYNNYKLFSTAENLIPIIEVSLKITKEQIHANKDLSPLIPFIKNKEVTFNLEKCKTLLLKNKRKEVLIIVKKLEDEVPENNIFKHHFYNTLAEIFFELGEKDKALKLYKKAYNTDFFNPKKDIIGEKYKNLTFASIYSEVNDMSTADKYFDSFIKDTVGLNIYQNPTAQGLLANYYNNKKNYKKAINYLKRKYFLNDSISQNGLEIANQIYAKELQFDKKIIILEQKAKQEQLLAEKQETKLKSTILIALLIFIILGISFYFFTKNRRTKAKLELAKTKEVLAFKNIFLENISHEMRTPITVILGYLTLIKENSLNPERIANYANLASVNTTNFLHSLNSFLTVKKLEKTSDLKLVEENRILLNFFKDTIIDFTQLAKEKQITLKFIYNLKENTEITFDYDVLTKIVTNLLSNALKFSNAQSQITVICLLKLNALEITVKDEGMGIVKEDQSKIFTRFYQSANIKNSGGFGIGLSLVKKLVEKMNGSIDLVSEVNIGSIFKVSLPVKAENIALLTVDETTIYFGVSDKDENNNAPSSFLPNALIVDDNLEIIKFYKEIFKDRLNCTFAYDGLEALNKIKTEQFDVIIADYRMPKLDGLEFKEQINTIENYKNIPFIMVSAIQNEHTDNYIEKYDINDYLLKPFDKNELIARVNALVKQLFNKKHILESNMDLVDNTKTLHSEVIEKTKKIILQNLNNPSLNVSFISDALGIHEKQLNKSLKEAIGLSTIKFIIEIRILKAYELIINKKFKTVSEVMFEVGFNSRTNFYDKFEKRFGITAGNLNKKY